MRGDVVRDAGMGRDVPEDEVGAVPGSDPTEAAGASSAGAADQLNVRPAGHGY